MNALLIWPAFPSGITRISINSRQEMVRLARYSSTNPPLGLLTVAAMLPSGWNIRFLDRHISPGTPEDWDWCDIVMLSGMIDQLEDFRGIVRMALERGKIVVAGGPLASSLPNLVKSFGVHFLVLDEGEITIPPFLEALQQGEKSGVFRAGDEKADVRQTPSPRYDLVDLNRYLFIPVQLARGCPFQCEFCDIIGIFGRKPRTKTHEQVLTDLNRLHELGFRRLVHFADDNFIGNKKNIKEFLRVLIDWQKERGYPFQFSTEASINMADDAELLALMVEAGFRSVFIGIETPEEERLLQIHKNQNTRRSMAESCRRIAQAGLQIYAGFILGFDNEPAGSGDRIADFIEEAAIPEVLLSPLVALPKAALWDRLKREDRLINVLSGPFEGDIINFIPTRPAEDILDELVDVAGKVYEPATYLRRTFRYFSMIGDIPPQQTRWPKWGEWRLFSAVLWRQGILRPSRFEFWKYLAIMLLTKRRRTYDYLLTLGIGEHGFVFREAIASEMRSRIDAMRKRSAWMNVVRKMSVSPVFPARTVSTRPGSDGKADGGHGKRDLAIGTNKL